MLPKFRFLHFLYFLLCPLFFSFAQYDQKLVKFDFKEFDSNPIGVIKLYLKNERIKVKYFASKDESDTPIIQRYNDWGFNKKMVLVSSGTYYYYPNKNNRNKNTALPVGICVENGKIINKTVEKNLGGLSMVYPSGRIIVQNLNDKFISVTQKNGGQQKLDLNDPFDKSIFFKWAEDVHATIFQTHLFAFQNRYLVGNNSNNFKDLRRFLASCTNEKGEAIHYVLNLPFNTTILEGSKIVLTYLKNTERVKDIHFLINLDTGAQNCLITYNPKNGQPLENPNFSGTKQIKEAINLLAYYYE